MPRPEWSPNEGYIRKFERLAFALVRTRPVKEVNKILNRITLLNLEFSQIVFYSCCYIFLKCCTFFSAEARSLLS